MLESLLIKTRLKEKRLQPRCFPVNIAKFLRTAILKNICQRLLLKCSNLMKYQLFSSSMEVYRVVSKNCHSSDFYELLFYFIFWNYHIQSSWASLVASNFNIVIRNGKIVWKHGPYCWYFRLNLRYLRCSYTAYIKTAKKGDLCEDLLC